MELVVLKNKEVGQFVLYQKISLKKMTTFSEKKYKSQKTHEIASAICALLNTGGGRLRINCDEESVRRITVYVRMIEQYVTEMIGILKMAELTEIQVNRREIIINVKQSRNVVTITYNMYLPSKSQVTLVPATTYVQGVREVLDKRVIDNCVIIGSHQTVFRKGTESGLY